MTASQRPHPTRTEMKTAIELADEFPEQNLANIEPDAANILNWWGIEAVAMLLQQAEQIEAIEAELRRAKNDLADALDCKKGMGPTALGTVLKERDALKALVDNPRNSPFGKEAEKSADGWLAANGPGGWIDDLRNKCEALEITNDALKADAERYQKLKNSCGFGIQKNGAIVLSICFYDKHPDHIGQLDAAIDAMKGKS